MKDAWLTKVYLPLILMLVVGCISANLPDPLENSSWVLVGTGSIENPTPLIPGTTITAVFQSNQISGSSGCNQYGADYTNDDMQIEISEIESTAVDCPSLILEQESKFLDALISTISFTLNDGVLVMETTVTPLIFHAIDVQGVEGLKTAVPENPLASITWQLVALETPDGPLPTRDAVITAQFETDHVSGTGGCNTYSANIHLAADAYLLLLNTINHSFDSCTDAVNQLETT
ncbi:MAG: META domain-containing protein, partial [Chloroflexi bacterium]|nr:META domain-containing protein [Chloroflexota bacterium]